MKINSLVKVAINIEDTKTVLKALKLGGIKLLRKPDGSFHPKMEAFLAPTAKKIYISKNRKNPVQTLVNLINKS